MNIMLQYAFCKKKKKKDTSNTWLPTGERKIL